MGDEAGVRSGTHGAQGSSLSRGIAIEEQGHALGQLPYDREVLRCKRCGHRGHHVTEPRLMERQHVDVAFDYHCRVVFLDG